MRVLNVTVPVQAIPRHRRRYRPLAELARQDMPAVAHPVVAERARRQQGHRQAANLTERLNAEPVRAAPEMSRSVGQPEHAHPVDAGPGLQFGQHLIPAPEREVLARDVEHVAPAVTPDQQTKRVPLGLTDAEATPGYRYRVNEQHVVAAPRRRGERPVNLRRAFGIDMDGEVVVRVPDGVQQPGELRRQLVCRDDVCQ
jgi:hypothetical protein